MAYSLSTLKSPLAARLCWAQFNPIHLSKVTATKPLESTKTLLERVLKHQDELHDPTIVPHLSAARWPATAGRLRKYRRSKGFKIFSVPAVASTKCVPAEQVYGIPHSASHRQHRQVEKRAADSHSKVRVSPTNVRDSPTNVSQPSNGLNGSLPKLRQTSPKAGNRTKTPKTRRNLDYRRLKVY